MVRRQAAPREPIEEHRYTQLLHQLAQRELAVPPVKIRARHDHRTTRTGQQADRHLHRRPVRSRSPPRRSRLAAWRRLAARRPLSGPALPRVRLGARPIGRLHEHVVQRQIHKARPSVGRARRRECFLHQSRDRRRARSRPCELRQRCHEGHVIDLLQRPLTPAPRRRAAPQHHNRRMIRLRARDGAHPIRHSRSRRQRADPGLARHLRPALRRERRGLLVAHVHDLDPLRSTPVVDGEQMSPRQREQPTDPLRAQPPRQQPPPVERLARLLRGRSALRHRLGDSIRPVARSTCPGWDSNPQDPSGTPILSRPRIPIPPPGRAGSLYRRSDALRQ